jgi:carboxymethylenebutenolidase
MGGALTIAGICTHTDKFDAAAPFYGIPDLKTFDVGKIKCPVLLHFAELDDAKGFSDPESAKNLSQKMAEKGVDNRLIIWEKGQHAFMNQDSSRFDKDISEKARKETIEFFKKHLN